MIKTIIFDYAGVITPTRDKSNFANKYSDRFGMKTPKLMDILYKNWDAAAIGVMSDKQYWSELGKNLKIEPEELKNLIIETFPIDQRIIKIIDSIKDQYTIIMVSNQIEDWLEKVIEENNLKDKFHYFTNSYHAGAAKPDKKIFMEALEKSNSKPEETLFIDDSTKNIFAAKNLGMETIQYNTYKQFVKELKQYIKVNI